MTKKMPVPCILPDNASPSPKPRRERPTLASGLLCAGILCLSFTAHAADDNKAQLKSIQQDIANKEKSVRSQKIQRSNLLDQLQSQEKIIAQASRQLRQTQTTLEGINRDIAALARSIAQLEQRQAREESLLAQQLDAAFRQGQHSGIELLLSGEAGQRNDRGTHRSTDPQAAMTVFTGIRLTFGFLEVFHRDHALQMERIVNHQRFFDTLFVHLLQNHFTGVVFFNSNQTLFRSHNRRNRGHQ